MEAAVDPVATMIEFLSSKGYGHERGMMAELAEKTGVGHGTIRTWFRPRKGQKKASRPSIEHAVAVARALDSSLDYLLTGTEFWSELHSPTTCQRRPRAPLSQPMGRWAHHRVGNVIFLVHQENADLLPRNP